MMEVAEFEIETTTKSERFTLDEGEHHLPWPAS